MKKYYFAMVDRFYDKRYEGLLEYERNASTDVYLKNIVKTIHTSKNFLGIKSAEEVFEPFPIIVECEKEINKPIEKITDIITGEVFKMLPNEMDYVDYKGESSLILYLGRLVTKIEVADELLRLCPDDIQRYENSMKVLKNRANKIALEDKKAKHDLEEKRQLAEESANNVIESFKKVYRNGK